MVVKVRKAPEAIGKIRMRREIVEAMEGLNKLGAIGDDEFRKTTMRMLGLTRAKVAPLSPSDIAEVRKRPASVRRS